MVGYQEGSPVTAPTLPQILREAGYATALAGRCMHQSPHEESYGFERQVLGSTYAEDDEYARTLRETLPLSGGIRGLGVSNNGWSVRPWPYAEELHPTHWAATQALGLLHESDSERPLFLTASFYAPHPPLIPPRFYFDRYMRLELPPPAVGAWVEPPENDGRGAGIDATRTVLRGEALRCVQAGYYGLINHIDDAIYWLIHEFKERSGKARRPWLVVFTSDHGEMLGDHYYYRKCEPYEGSTRIPLMIEGSPDLGFRNGQVLAQPVCLEDLMPTLLELAGADAPSRLDGHSLVPVLRGNESGVRPWLHGEHAPIYTEEQAYHFLTDGSTKYIWRPATGHEQLFDLVADPRELRDLAPQPVSAETLRGWRERLVSHLAGRPEGFSDGTRLIPGRPYQDLMPHAVG
jgi:arylsulfatase